MTLSPDPWAGGGLPSLNVAATCTATKALGPGVRAVVWVQGCPLNCHGCVAPAWIPPQIARLVPPEQLADELLARPEITGLTFSGGEPMLQAAGLARLIRYARHTRPLSLICFTGLRLEQLHARPPGPGVAELLAEVDLLIDGPYVAAQDDNRGMRGSANQRVIHLTGRIPPDSYNFIDDERQAEIHVAGGEALLVGVPANGLAAAFERAVQKARVTTIAELAHRGPTPSTKRSLL